MKRNLCFLLWIMCSLPMMAQGAADRPITVIAEISDNSGDMSLALFDMPEETTHHYYLCVGALGIGDDFVQVNIDPVSQLFLDLGTDLASAQATLDSYAALAKEPTGTRREAIGILAIGSPANGTPEMVSMTARQSFLSKAVEFSLQRNDYKLATYVQRSDLNSIIFNIKLQRKMYPNG